jgi:HSP20 family protein
MALMKWDPWQEMLSAQRQAQDMFRRLFGDWRAPESFGAFHGATGFAPAVETFSRDGDLVVRAELPGIDPEKDVDITFHDNVLTIRGERRRENKHEGDQYFRSESFYGMFERQVALPEGAQPEDISASYKDGILEVVVPKAAELSEPRKIPIASGSGRKALTTKGRKK